MKIAALKNGPKVLLAFALASCVSTFELDLPPDHPADPEAPTAGPLVIPDPARIDPPEAKSEGGMGGGMEMEGDPHGGHR